MTVPKTVGWTDLRQSASAAEGHRLLRDRFGLRIRHKETEMKRTFGAGGWFVNCGALAVLVAAVPACGGPDDGTGGEVIDKTESELVFASGNPFGTETSVTTSD